MDTPSVRPSKITPAQKPQSPHIITSDEKSLSSKPSILPSMDINRLPQHPTKVPPNEPSVTTLHKNSVEPIPIRTLNMVHRDATNLPPIPPSLTLAPCENRTQFKSLNLHCIFGCRKFRNQKHLTAETNASIVSSCILPSSISSFATIKNPTKGKKNQKSTTVPQIFHMGIVFGDCVALGGNQHALILVDVATRY